MFDVVRNGGRDAYQYTMSTPCCQTFSEQPHIAPMAFLVPARKFLYVVWLHHTLCRQCRLSRTCRQSLPVAILLKLSSCNLYVNDYHDCRPQSERTLQPLYAHDQIRQGMTDVTGSRRHGPIARELQYRPSLQPYM